MLFIPDETVAQVLDYPSVVAELDAAYRDLASGTLVIHPRQRSAADPARLSTMGALWQARHVAAVKSYTTVAGEFNFAVNLFDSRRNRLLACLEGAELTRFRTAAQTALVASRLLRGPLRKVALFGAGVQGRAQAAALASQFAIEELCVVDPHADGRWVREFAANESIVTRHVDAQEAVHGADLIVTATRSNLPLFPGEWLQAGQVVVAMGTSTAAGRELDDAAMDAAQTVILEWLPQSLQEAGEVVQWTGRAAGSAKITDLAALYKEGVTWPDPARGAVVFKSVGTGLADVAAAQLAYARVCSRSAAE